jgi:hypothetical protein
VEAAAGTHNRPEAGTGQLEVVAGTQQSHKGAAVQTAVAAAVELVVAAATPRHQIHAACHPLPGEGTHTDWPATMGRQLRIKSAKLVSFVAVLHLGAEDSPTAPQ